jgi:hypothetical protein
MTVPALVRTTICFSEPPPSMSPQAGTEGLILVVELQHPAQPRDAASRHSNVYNDSVFLVP